MRPQSDSQNYWANRALSFLERHGTALVTVLIGFQIAGLIWHAVDQWSGKEPLRPAEALTIGSAAVLVTVLTLLVRRIRKIAEGFERRVEERTEELRESEAQYRSLFEHATDAFVICTPEGRIVEANAKAGELFGYMHAELLHMDLRGLTDEASYPAFRELSQALRSGVLTRASGTCLRKGGQRLEVEAQGSPFLYRSLPHVLCVARDVTERLRQEDARREALSAAEMANRSKSDFLANMSHEIRTPMTAILGYADCLADEALDPKDRAEWVATIRRNGQHLLTIINDILDISKIEAGKITLEELDYSPEQLIRDVGEMMRVRATNQKIGFSLEFEDGIPATIRTDPTRLRQILINLIGNAIKFTPEGEVRVVSRFVRDASEPSLEVEVRDSGIGISEEQMAYLFEPFGQADSSVTRQFGGTGLGLAISKRLAKILGGDISVVSEQDVGSRFVLRIATGPLGEETAAAPRLASRLDDYSWYTTDGDDTVPSASIVNETKPLTGIRVLLAEDGVDNQRLIRLFLTKAGAEVDIAENGRVALSKLLDNCEATYPVVLMDMQMPELDGYSATSALREAGFEAPVIALTAHAMAHDKKRCLDAGCTAFLSKPVQREELIQTIVQQLDESRKSD